VGFGNANFWDRFFKCFYHLEHAGAFLDRGQLSPASNADSQGEGIIILAYESSSGNVHFLMNFFWQSAVRFQQKVEKEPVKLIKLAARLYRVFMR